MMENNFMVESANISNLDDQAEGMNILRESKKDVKINSILSNSFGFGGTNASIYITRYND
jgi:3-oxoacyl-[acyl-carrier-protein] synthase-1